MRNEILFGLTHGVRVVPALVNGGTAPDINELSECIANLSGKHALELRHGRWKDDVRHLMETVGVNTFVLSAEPRRLRLQRVS